MTVLVVCLALRSDCSMSCSSLEHDQDRCSSCMCPALNHCTHDSLEHFRVGPACCDQRAMLLGTSIRTDDLMEFVPAHACFDLAQSGPHVCAYCGDARGSRPQHGGHGYPHGSELRGGTATGLPSKCRGVCVGPALRCRDREAAGGIAGAHEPCSCAGLPSCGAARCAAGPRRGRDAERDRGRPHGDAEDDHVLVTRARAADGRWPRQLACSSATFS